MQEKGITYKFPFSIYARILSTDELHFGLWNENTENLEDAQQNLTELLLSLVPKKICRILDVGCGFGKFAFTLAQRGHMVTALDDEEAKIRYCRQKYRHKGLRFVNKGFMDDDLEQLIGCDFDLVVFFESTQYFEDLFQLFSKCRALLNKKGRVLFCDEMVYKGEDADGKAGVKSRRRYVRALLEAGFRIMRNMKLGDNVKRTCSAVLDRLKALQGDTETGMLMRGWEHQEKMYESGMWGYELFEALKDEYFLTGYSAGLERDILEMFRDVFKVPRTLAHWRWKHMDCPFGNKAIAVAKDTSKTIVAHFSGYYVPVEDTEQGKQFRILHVGDTMTRPEARWVGIGRSSLFARTGMYFFARYCEQKMPYVYGFNTATAQRLGKLVLNYQPVSPVSYLAREDAALRKSFIKNLVARSLYFIKEIKSFGPEYDDLYMRIKDQYKGILVKRDSMYLNWRFADPEKDYTILEMRSRWSLLVGYMVLATVGGNVFIGDVFVDRYHLLAINLALLKAENAVGPGKQEMWLSNHPAWLRKHLIKLGFKDSKEPNGLWLMMLPFDSEYNVNKMNRFFYTKADSDLF